MDFIWVVFDHFQYMQIQSLGMRLIWSSRDFSELSGDDVKCTTVQNLSLPGIARRMIHQRLGLLVTGPTPET